MQDIAGSPNIPFHSAFHSAIEALEWRRFLGLAIREARSEPAQLWLASLHDPALWPASVVGAQALQAETHEMLGLLQKESLWGVLRDLKDPLPSIEALDKGRILGLEDLVLLRSWLYAIDSWSQIPKDEVAGRFFKKVLSDLPEPREPLRVFHQILTPLGEISEKASPKYGGLLRELRSLKIQIEGKLDELSKIYSQKGFLQDRVTDFRDGRYVLPVKMSQQSEVAGFVTDTSVSRHTAYIEPKEVEALNQRLRQVQNELNVELYLILEATSKKLSPFASEIESSALILIHWDCAQARARLGRHYSGKTIQVAEGHTIQLNDTANPLLWWSLEESKIIRNDIQIAGDARTLLITGPNTGGKTVLLKTLGLAALCARTGFPFPSSDRAIIPFFESVQMDVGDAQSIEKHLSSFSGHVLQFKRILDHLTENTLILLDELNAATDPQEGAALARAFLEFAMKKNPILVATTHDPHLKALAMTDPRLLIASMEFNEATHEPTYRLVLGVPGRSRALDIAERLGLPPDLLKLARGYLSVEHLKFENLVAKLEEETQSAAKNRKETQTLREEAEKLKTEWTTRTETSVSEMLDKTRNKLRRVLEQAQDDFRLNLRRLEEMKGTSPRELEKSRRALQESADTAERQITSALSEEAPEVVEQLQKQGRESETLAALPVQPKSEFRVGDWVRIPKFKTLGQILEISADKSGTKLKVALGNPSQAKGSALKMQLTDREVQALGEGELRALWAQMPAHARPLATGRVNAEPVEFGVAPELDLRGVRFEDAMVELERYIDRAFRAGKAQVLIIHGIGTGALREGTLQFLRKIPYIRQFGDGGAGGGGPGATLVEFERD